MPLAPARSPFQKPSVQVMSLSDDAFEAGSAQVIPVASSRRPLLLDVSRILPSRLHGMPHCVGCSELACDSGVMAMHAEPCKGRCTSKSCVG